MLTEWVIGNLFHSSKKIEMIALVKELEWNSLDMVDFKTTKQWTKILKMVHNLVDDIEKWWSKMDKLAQIAINQSDISLPYLNTNKITMVCIVTCAMM